MLAYLDPGSGDQGIQIGAVVLVVLAVAIVAAGLYWIIRLAVRHGRRDDAVDD